MARALFVMEQQVGHRTYYQNLRRFVDEDSRLDAAWVRVSYKEPGGFWERLPVVSANLRGALRARTGRCCHKSRNTVRAVNAEASAISPGATQRSRSCRNALDIMAPQILRRMGQSLASSIKIAPTWPNRRRPQADAKRRRHSPTHRPRPGSSAG